MSDIKDGDLYSYATINVASHGFMIKTNDDFCYPVEVTDWKGVEVLSCSSGSSSNVVVPKDDIGKLVWDRRLTHDSLVMVYRSGKSREQVLEMVRPQLREHLLLRKELYEMMTFNCGEMADVLTSGNLASELEEGHYLCSTAPGKKQK